MGFSWCLHSFCIQAYMGYKPRLLSDCAIKNNLTRAELGDALLIIVEELQDDFARLNDQPEPSAVIYAEPMKQFIRELCLHESDEGDLGRSTR